MADDEIPVHFIHQIKTKLYDVIGVNVFPSLKLMRFPLEKGLKHSYTTPVINGCC